MSELDRFQYLALMAACLGGGLAVAGAVLQALLCNPLAEPYVLGISAGASTGAVMVVVLGLGGGLVSLSGGAFFGALLVVAQVFVAPALGATLYLGIIVTVGVVTSIALDHYGLVGFEPHAAGLWRILGGVLMIAGVALVAIF